MELSQYIAQLEQRQDWQTYISYPANFLANLHDIDNMIGLNDMKKQVMRQTIFLMSCLEEGKRDGFMLNTCLYADKGMGKTTIAIKLARLWQSMGYLDAYIPTLQDHVQDIYENTSADMLILYIYLAAMVVWAIYAFVAKPFSGLKYGWLIAVSVLIVAFLILIGLYYYFYIYSPVQQKHQRQQEQIKCMEAGNCDASKGVGADSDVLNRYIPTDLKGQYVGWTKIETRKRIKQSRGKVFFLDEAYELITNSAWGDSYGQEALVEIMTDMDVHRGKTFYIFAGYYDKMRKQLFNGNEGLERRFTTHIYIERYTAAQLFEIYLLQLKKSGLTLAPEALHQTRQLIINNYHLFDNNGGDTENLAYYTNLAYAVRLDHRDKICIYEDVQAGLQDLQSNHLTKRGIPSKTNYSAGKIDMSNLHDLFSKLSCSQENQKKLKPEDIMSLD